MAANLGETLSCAILPLQSTGGILLPASALVEVVDSTELNVVVDLQSGILGKMQWKNTAIPLISYEAAATLVPAAFAAGTKAVVVRIAVDDISLKYMAIAVSSAPRVIELSRGHIKEVPAEDELDNFLAYARVQVDGQLLWLPNMESVALHILEQAV